MNFPASPDSWESETASFISTLKEVFEGERWDDIRARVHEEWHRKA